MFLYGEQRLEAWDGWIIVRHDAFAMAAAINYIAEDLEYEDKWSLFHLLVENVPINSLMTHSYGFHTANGRHIIESIQEKYYEYTN